MTRRELMQTTAGALVGGAAMRSELLAAQDPSGHAAGRQIRFVSIGTGIRGCDLLRSARQVPSGILVGTADLYDMHQQAGKEAYGADVPTTRDYRSLLDRKDVDAVIVAVTDHQHRRVVLDAVAAGKDVYCEKPMSHTVADGVEMVKAVQAGKRIFECGSQRVSSILYKKAAEIYASGRLGEVHYIEGHCDRNSPSGAWVYPIAPDATPQSIDWTAFLRDAPARPFDAARFFRWRCFTDYGEGVAGDLYVHLLSGMQCVSGINAVPSRAYSSGSLTHFNDGRDFPDLLATVYDYPGVTVDLHCNQNNEAGEAITFYGKEATLAINGNTITVTPQDTAPRPEGYSLNGWTAALKRQYMEEWRAAHAAPAARLREVESYSALPGYDDTVDHLANFFRAVETREHVVEDEVFGNNAAIACHMANYSYFKRTVATWDAGAEAVRG
ncbi:MAG TPA: Gfo/Idh/MocA family oxidoreductase [Bryobacteraceae bacterium]|nr:Gfo/Idh/MocA family oxidoreductase [Bryobacteraceae bacterium]